MNTTEIAGFLTRDGTVDANAVYSLAEDEYRLKDRKLTGWAVDVGSQIGTIAITLARTNPDLRVIAVEAVPENYELLLRNVQAAGLEHRVRPVHAFASQPGQERGHIRYGYRHREEESDGYLSAHRFVGNTWANLGEPEFDVELPAISLDDIVADVGDITLLKIDCEGCEWAFLNSPAIGRVQTIIGEYHGGYSDGDMFQYQPRDAIHRLLDATHEVTFWSEEPTIGLFEANRR